MYYRERVATQQPKKLHELGILFTPLKGNNKWAWLRYCQFISVKLIIHIFFTTYSGYSFLAISGFKSSRITFLKRDTGVFFKV